MVERKNTPISQPIRCKTETNRDLVTRVFTRGRGSLIFFFHLEFSLAPCDAFLRSDWLPLYLRF